MHASQSVADPAPPLQPAWRKPLVCALMLAFAVWCAVAFRHDIVQIDLTPFATGGGALALALAGGLSLFNYLMRVLRWQLYLRRLGHDLPFGFVALTFMSGFAFTLSPGKLGEMVRARYYQPRGIALSAVTGAFFVERLLDLVAMILLAAVVLTELQAYRAFFWVAVALVLGLLLGVAGLPWPRVAEALARRPSGRLVKALSGVVRTLVSARLFLSPGLLAVGLLLGVMAWAAEALGLKVIADVVGGVTLSTPAAMGIYAIAIIVGALSFLPGGLGSTEAVMAALLVAHGYTMPQAILLTLVCRLLTLWLAVVIGWGCVWLLRADAPGQQNGEGARVHG